MTAELLAVSGVWKRDEKSRGKKHIDERELGADGGGKKRPVRSVRRIIRQADDRIDGMAQKGERDGDDAVAVWFA